MHFWTWFVVYWLIAGTWTFKLSTEEKLWGSNRDSLDYLIVYLYSMVLGGIVIPFRSYLKIFGEKV